MLVWFLGQLSTIGVTVLQCGMLLLPPYCVYAAVWYASSDG